MILLREKLEIPHVVNSILDKIPYDKLIYGVVIDPVMAGGQFMKEVERRKREAGLSLDMIRKTCYGYTDRAMTRNYAINKHGLVGTYKVGDVFEEYMNLENATWLGNPPFNNKGKGAVKNNTSGTSLWIEFLDNIARKLSPGAECSLVLPRAVLNTNSVGYKKIAHMTVLEASTKVDHHFSIGTAICTIRFKNERPKDNMMLIDGMLIDRDLVPVLPKNVCKESVSIMKKIGQFNKIEWTRSGWKGFAAADRSKVIGKTFMDRDKHYNFWDFDEMDARNLKKVNLCWIETPYKKKMISLLKKKLFSFHCQQTALSGNLSIGVMRTLSLPDNWTDLKTDQDVYEAYGLTAKEIAFLEKELA